MAQPLARRQLRLRPEVVLERGPSLAHGLDSSMQLAAGSSCLRLQVGRPGHRRGSRLMAGAAGRAPEVVD
eukprot:6664646-Alexandrium_andersonii.AAC.1